jgi:hypothetical protein
MGGLRFPHSGRLLCRILGGSHLRLRPKFGVMRPYAIPFLQLGREAGTYCGHEVLQLWSHLRPRFINAQ